jgi:choline kinase
MKQSFIFNELTDRNFQIMMKNGLQEIVAVVINNKQLFLSFVRKHSINNIKIKINRTNSKKNILMMFQPIIDPNL